MNTVAEHLSTELKDLHRQLDHGSSTGFIGGEAVAFDRASIEAAAAFSEASDIAGDLSLLSRVSPEACQVFDARVRDLCTALGTAIAARGRFLATTQLLASLIPDKQC